MSYIIILFVITLIAAMYLNVMNGALRALEASHRKGWTYARMWPTPQRLVIEDFKYKPLQVERRISRYEMSMFNSEHPMKAMREGAVREMEQTLFMGLKEHGYLEMTEREDMARFELVLRARIYVAPPPTR